MTARLADLLASVLFAGILTCWAPGYWPVALVETGAFILCAWVVISHLRVPADLVGLSLAGMVAWGVWQFTGGVTVYRFETGKALLFWAGNASVFVAARAACLATPARNRFLRGLLWFSSLVSLMAVVQYFTSQGKVFWLFPAGQERVLGPFLYKNECAAFIELVFPLALYQSLVDDRDSLLYVGMAAAMFAAVITAASRAGAVLVICELVVVLLLSWRRGLIPAASLRRKAAWTAVLGVALAAVVGWHVTLEKFREPEPYRVRRELLLSSVAMVADRPITGFGLGTWPVVYPAYARFDNGLAANHAHNDWAEWAVEGGVPFFALMTLLALWSVRPAAESLWGIGVPVIFAHSLVDYPLREPAVAAVFFAMLGALAARTEAPNQHFD
ncbi:MAG TPA: O-antigen ligase family protein [Bryobacteraceae bacterium]|nr:O-antigen ligase family protein [Bryobacteraceae bacterium]